jgi:AcrR family transcriptional regulator
MTKTNKKELFFEESLKLIHEKGFKATTLRDIAKRLDFEVANVYNYIESKQSLLEEYVVDTIVEFHSSIDYIVDSSYTPEDKLRTVVSHHIQMAVNKPYHLALIENEWRNLKEPKLTYYLEQRESYKKKISTIISEGIKAGEFRSLNTDIITSTFLASFRWIYKIYTNPEQKVNPIELEKQLVDYILKGVSNKL